MRLIDADAFERRCMFDSNIEDMQDVIYALRDYSTVPAIPIPEGATNGDVIKAIFSDNVFAEERWQDENGKMCTDVISDNGMTFTDIWWNSPYKRGDTE